jgi:hypothetical protein
MSQEKVGREFIKHEFDEAISIQSRIVETARSLSRSHPQAESRRLIERMARSDERQLEELKRLGKPYGAKGVEEEVAKALGDLARETTAHAGDAPSEAYEAHAVLLTLKRKQQDSAAAVLKIARSLKETDLRDSAQEMLRETKKSAQSLADALATLAVSIATGSKPTRA